MNKKKKKQEEAAAMEEAYNGKNVQHDGQLMPDEPPDPDDNDREPVQ